MREKIKKHLPIFQLGAVTITIVLGIMTGIDKVLSTRPIVLFKENSFTITQNGLVDSALNNVFTVKFKKRFGNNCEFIESNVVVEDSDKFTHKVSITTPSSLGDEDNDGFEEFSFIFTLIGEDDIPFYKTNRLKGSFVYACGNEFHTVKLPSENLFFYYLPPAIIESGRKKK